MPRRRSAPRLYLDPTRRQWIIRDGPSFIRTGCVESDGRGAQVRLAAYLAEKYEPPRGANPLIADVLLVYASEHLPHTKTTKNSSYNVSSLDRWWRDKSVSDITARSCRDYAALRTPAAARRDIEVLRAACRFWQRERGALSPPPSIVLPARSERKDRWLTRAEAARLLNTARATPHLRRFILLGLYTGSRPGVILRLQWDQVDLVSGVMARRAAGEAQDARKRAPRVRLGNRILAHLRRWHRLDPPETRYLCHYDGRPVQKLRRSFPEAARRAGLAGVTPHTLRHTRATWMMQEGVPIWEAAGALGMTTQVLEETYGHHHPDWQKRAAEV